MSFSSTFSLWRCRIVGCLICLSATDSLGCNLNLRLLLHLLEAWMIRLLSFLNFCMLAGFSQFVVDYHCQETLFFQRALSFSGFDHMWKTEANLISYDGWRSLWMRESILYACYLQVHFVWDIFLKKCVEVFCRVFNYTEFKRGEKNYSRHSIYWE